MTTTIDYLNAVKAKTGAGSDYALAKILGVKQSCISNYRSGRSNLDDLMCLKVASLLEIDPLMVISAVNMERSKNETVKRLWKEVFERLGGVAASVLLGIMLNAPNSAEASNGEGYKTAKASTDLYIMRNRQRRTRSYNPLSFLVESMLKLA